MMAFSSAETGLVIDQLRRRVADLEGALTHQRDLTAAERRRADSLEDAAARAWRTAAFTVPRREPEPEIKPAPVPSANFNRPLSPGQAQTARPPDPGDDGDDGDD